MKTILHIGMAKTGSTALQSSLSQSRQTLIGKGLLFPENPPGCRYTNHKSLLPGIVEVSGLPRHLLRGRSDEVIKAEYHAFRAHLDVQLLERRPEALILSTESLFRPMVGQAGLRFRQILDDIEAEPHVVAYLRRPSAHYLSGVQQHLKASLNVREPRQGKYKESLQSYLEVFGQERLSLHLFERTKLVNGDIVADFATRHLAEWGIAPSDLSPPKRSNETLCAEAMDLLRLYRMGFHAERHNLRTRDTAGLLESLQDASAALGVGRPQLQEGIADLVDYSTTEMLWVRDQFGLTLDDYDYARIERGDLLEVPERDWRLADIVQIDRDLQASLAQHLAESAWADAGPARKAWALEQARAPGENETMGTIDLSATRRRKRKAKKAPTAPPEVAKAPQALPWIKRMLRGLRRLKAGQKAGGKATIKKSANKKGRARLE